FSGSAALLLVMPDTAHFFTDGRYLEQAPQQVSGCEIYFDLPTTAPREHKGLLGLLHYRGLLLPRTTVGVEADSMVVAQFQTLQTLFPEVKWKPIQGLVARLAMVKDAGELESLKRAVHITDTAFTEIVKAMKPGDTEKEVAAKLSYLLRLNGAEKDSFEPIVASGERGALPHARPSDKPLEKGDFVVLDFGAVFDGYHADMTRTVCMGPATDRHHEIYDIVLSAQLAGIAAIRGSVEAKEVDHAARSHIAQHGYGNEFIHGTGHGIGLEVHTPPRLSSESTDILEAGMVVTVEPGIYLKKWGGVRIEDDVLVLLDGSAPLNQSTKELLVLG
ncbi:MAG: aminopeptidase P family protein, partial [Candidatus Marinimicrobia bacterium]|nr:aminopeptidase P family protein [Candidatus Neomarinimicrobiota bacterium]